MSNDSRIDAEKKAEEKHDFLRFVDDGELQIDEASIKQLNPPAPDLEVFVDGVGAVAFELGDMNSRNRHKGISLMEQSGHRMRTYVEQLPEPRRSAFLEKYKGAHITLSVSHTPRRHHEKKPTLSIEQALPKLVEHLESLNDGYWGSAFAYNHGPNPSVLEKYERGRTLLESIDMLADLHVSRSPSDKAPRFQSFGGGSVLRLDASVLTKKLAKKYTTDLPIDLVLTVKMGDSAHLGEMEAFQQAARDGLDASPYARIWLHERLSGKVTQLAGPALRP